MGPRKILGLDHFRKELRGGLQSIVNFLNFAVRKDDLSTDQLQYTFEDWVRVAHYFQQMFATRAVCSGKPVLCRPLICASPSHQRFDCLMTVAQRYDLICGQGRLEAYQSLGQREIRLRGPGPISAGTAGEAARWGGSIAVMGMAANPSGAHQAGRVFAGRIDVGGVSACDVGRARWHACGQ
jgi:hypothetical protein